MQCPESARCLSAYILDELAPSDRKAFKNHLLGCAQCSAELASFERVNTVLNSWDDEALPVSAAAHRERIRNLAEPLSKQEKASRLSLFNWWQWAPSALSFAVLVLVFMNASFLVDENGFSVSFGGLKNGASAEQMVDREELHQVIARLEQRQDQNNIALMQAVLNQTRESSEANFQQLFAFFEQQRLNDLEQVRASYDQLAESDFETLRSLQQLASYVSFNEIVR